MAEPTQHADLVRPYGYELQEAWKEIDRLKGLLRDSQAAVKWLRRWPCSNIRQDEAGGVYCALAKGDKDA